MTVHYEYEVGSISSNKTIIVPVKLIALKYGDIIIFKPKIDKISITYDITDMRHQKYILQMMWDLAKEGHPFLNAPPKFYSKHYKTCLLLRHPQSNENILIHTEPKPNKAGEIKNPFMRLEFNPHKLGSEGMEFLKSKLCEVFLDNYTWNDIVTHGKVTRLDVAVDILNVPISDLLIQSTKPGKVLSYFGEDGTVETVYLGKKKNKPSSVYIYNKSQQRLDSKKQHAYKGFPHSRVEIRQKTSRQLLSLHKLKNPLKSLSLFHPGFIENVPKPIYNWSFFLDSCRFRGKGAALAIISDTDVKETYKQSLEQARKAFWKPDEIWKTWPEALNKSGLLNK